jgi:hypothetical protein
VFFRKTNGFEFNSGAKIIIEFKQNFTCNINREMIIITDGQSEETQERQNGERNFNPTHP